MKELCQNSQLYSSVYFASTSPKLEDKLINIGNQDLASYSSTLPLN